MKARNDGQENQSIFVCGANDMVASIMSPGCPCWNKRITAIPTSTWREISGQEQQERMHVTERETMVKIRLVQYL